MLGKLIKYDMKALNRFLIVIHAFLLLSAVLVRFFLTDQITLMAMGDGVFLGLAILLYSLIIVGVSYGTLIIIAIRFYKNLFSDEGYLTHTLPVTSGQHLLSKTISGSIWALIDSILIFASLYIVTFTPALKSFLALNKDELLAEFGLTAETFRSAMFSIVLVLIVTTVLGAFANVIMIYASVTLGQLFSGHRVLGAVVVYFVLTTVISVLSFAVTSLTGFYSPGMASENIYFIELFSKTLWMAVGLELIISVILYLVTHYIMKKKINLI